MTLFDVFRAYLNEEVGVVLATVVAGPRGLGEKLLVRAGGLIEGSLTSSELERTTVEHASRLLEAEHSETQDYQIGAERYSVFFDVFPAPPQLIIVGASNAASALCSFAARAGYRVIVCDACRNTFPELIRCSKGGRKSYCPICS
jgi:xanthine dehydrogenase accessory factor